MVRSSAQYDRMRTLIHPGPICGVHVRAEVKEEERGII